MMSGGRGGRVGQKVLSKPLADSFAVGRRQKHTFTPGRKVWLFTPRSRPGQPRKLTLPWTGPWTVCVKPVNETLVRIAPDPSWTTVTTSKVVYIGRLRVYNDGTSKTSVEPQDEDDILMMDDVYAEAIDLQPYYDDQPAVDIKRPPQPPPDDRQAKPPGGGRPPRQPPGGRGRGGGGGGGMRLRPRHRRPVAAAVQQNAMDVDDGIAAPAAPNAEVIPNHLPGGGQQNQAAHVAPVLVLRPHPGPADRRQIAIDHAAAAARHIRFRHHLHQHRPIHP
jgi:hypothetical protein